ncbi:LSU ribosomal protein L29p (L35e) [Olavius algarvensis associated proteobacterium Delta 3]|nr:LSU ribosomal protein L29p (L35e) [Olavius algarvensis associated proteobacterium Delta 3]CAB5122555.1 LSU ribosomal protein L29p (L35e) [Olavius algarvensis associated proteobacterium Delta 3]
MKASEIREMSPDEMRQKLQDAKQELFNLRFQHEVGQLENPKKLVQTKRDIARMRTILREAETKLQSDNA